MAGIHSIRQFHSELDIVCCSLEAVFRLAGQDHEEIEAATAPALQRFRELLDLGDSIAGPDPE